MSDNMDMPIPRTPEDKEAFEEYSAEVMGLCPVCRYHVKNKSGYCDRCEPEAAELHRAGELRTLVSTMTPDERTAYRAALEML